MTKPAFEEKRQHLLENLEQAHRSYYTGEAFGGPSLYFHLKSLDAAKSGNREWFTDYVYAALVAWKMDRGKAQVQDFTKFSDSLNLAWSLASGLREKTPSDLVDEDWDNLKKIFISLNCMKSKTILVGNSKVMAHLLPNLIPPVDRRYTLTFLFGKGEIINDPESEWKTLYQILNCFFYPIWRAPAFRDKLDEWAHDKSKFPWDTSALKTIDNLIIGLVNG